MKVPSLKEIKTHRKRTPDVSCVLDEAIPVPLPPSPPSPPIIGSGKAHENLAKRYENPIEKRQKAEISLTLHPPEGKFAQEEIRKTPAYVTERIMSIGYHNDEQLNEQHLGKLVDLKLAKTGFGKEEQRKPIYAIEAFLIAHEAGLYPPMWVLNYMAQIFSEWHNLQGTKSLDELMGLKPGTGQAPLFKKDYEESRDASLCLTVFLLKTLFNFTVEEASHLAARRLEETLNWNKTMFNIKKISEDTIKDRYKKKYGKFYSKANYVKYSSDWSDEKKLRFLKGFPEDAFPTKERKTLNDLKKILKA